MLNAAHERRRGDDRAARPEKLRGGSIERSGQTFRRLANTYAALFIVNDDPYLALELGADGVHVGQDDMDPGEARADHGSGRDHRPLHPHSRADRGGRESARRLHQRRPDLGDADEGGATRDRARADPGRRRRSPRSPGSRSAGSTPAMSDEVVDAGAAANLRRTGDPRRRGPASGGHDPLRRGRPGRAGRSGADGRRAGPQASRAPEAQAPLGRAAEPVPVDAQARPMQEAAESNGDGAQRRPSRSGWPAATRSATPRRARSSSRWSRASGRPR